MRKHAALVGIRHPRFSTAKGRKDTTQGSKSRHKTKFALNGTNTAITRGHINSPSALIVTNIEIIISPQLW